MDHVSKSKEEIESSSEQPEQSTQAGIHLNKIPKIEGTSKEQPAVPVAVNSLSDPIMAFLNSSPKLRLIVVTVLAIFTLTAFVGGLAVWYFGYPWIWDWGFSPTITWKVIPGAFMMLFLIYAPGIAYFPYVLLNKVLALYVNEQAETQLTRVFRDAQSRQEALEKKLEEEDQGHLVSIIQYSQAQLREYYAIGLGQTQRSFRYSIIAMWLGFIILLGGLALYVFPVENIGLKAPTAGVNTLVIGSGAIVEFISAMFLWVYRRSVGQLTYFYNRQMHTHNILLSYRISDTMTDKDTTKKLIIEHILNKVWSPQTIEAPSSKGFARFQDNK